MNHPVLAEKIPLDIQLKRKTSHRIDTLRRMARSLNRAVTKPRQYVSIASGTLRLIEEQLRNQRKPMRLGAGPYMPTGMRRHVEMTIILVG
jgi:hypothetical protein